MALFHTTVLDNQVKALPTVSTASGAIATFNTDLTENLVSVKCQIVAKQASGTPSPVNPLPITTYTEMNVTRCGNNLFNTTFSDYTRPSDYRIFPIKLKQGVTYNYSAELIGTAQTGFTVGVAKKGDRYTEFGAFYTICNGTDKTGSFTVDSTFTDPKLIVYANTESVFNAIFENYEIQLNEGDLLPYTPYNGTTSNIPFGQTVANGVLDITTGKLRVTWFEVDLGSLSWTRKTDGAIPYFRHDFTDSSLTQLNRAFLCSNYPNVPFSDIYTNGQDKASSSYSGGIFIISDTDYSDATAFTNAMSGVQLIYELATPIEIQLDSITLQALLNENNIWCDTGNTEVKYLLTVGKKIS